MYLFRKTNSSPSDIYELVWIPPLVWHNIISFYQRPYVPAILKLHGSEILSSRQQTAVKFNGMTADGWRLGANAAVRRTELVKYGIFGVHVAVCVTDCECVCVCVWLWGMARCCFGTWSQENKRLGSLRPHQLPSTLGQCRENQITCDHKHLPNKWNVVIWGCFWKMTDMQGGLQGPELSQLRAARHEKKRERKSQELWEVRKRVWLFGKTHTLI